MFQKLFELPAIVKHQGVWFGLTLKICTDKTIRLSYDVLIKDGKSELWNKYLIEQYEKGIIPNETDLFSYPGIKSESELEKAIEQTKHLLRTKDLM